MSTAVSAVLSLGSNLGDRAATLEQAIADIAAIPGIEVSATSRVYETVALKPEGADASAPAYLNLVAAVATRLAPEALLSELNRIEREHGRTRETHWGDRTLDIDIVTMGGLHLQSERLTLPHPQAALRGFVLVPWLELDPDAELPGIGRIDGLPAAHEDVPRYRAEV